MKMWKKRGAFVPLLLTMCLLIGGCGSMAGLQSESTDGTGSPGSAASTGQDAFDWKDTLEGEAALSLHFLDVGQGDSILALSEGTSMLVDAGEKGQGEGIVQYLMEQGVEKLDYLVLTHPHADHIGGALAVLGAFPVDTVILPRAETATRLYTDVLEAVAQSGCTVKEAKPGLEFSLGKAGCSVLGPVEPDSANLNDSSAVLRVSCGEVSFLLTGDAEKGEEQDILESGAVLKSDVLKAGHHGSGTSTSPLFLEAVSPQVAVVSVGQGNSYGLPDEETLLALEKRGTQVLRTDESGTVVLTTDGKELSLWTEKEGLGELLSEEANGTAGQETDQAYVGNRNTQVFHREDCPSVPKIKESNRLSFKNRDEAVEAGFRPCQNCAP